MMVLVNPDGEVLSQWVPTDRGSLWWLSPEFPPPLLEWGSRWLAEFRERPMVAMDPVAQELAQRFGVRTLHPDPSSLPDLRGAPWWPRISRNVGLDMARERLARELSSPPEVVITLSRERDRVERWMGREEEVLEALRLSGSPDGVVARYRELSLQTLDALRARRERLDRALLLETTRILPNLTALLGARTAARLLAHSSSLDGLSRLGASRIQLLGAKRRPPGGNGPRHGLLYNAEGMDRVPPSRRGALARTLGSLAAPAIRADLLTHGSLGTFLVARREARIRELNRPRRPRTRNGPRGGA